MPLINSPARTVPDPNDPTGFFTTVADKLLRSTFSFGITNIPVQTNGVFVYTPAVQRLLQVTANVLDASTTNFYPTVFRPSFYRDPSGNIFITGYQQVVSVTGINDPQLSQPLDLAALPPGVSSNANIYGVPWIIGVKKGFPGFDQFDSRNDVMVTRKIQLTRDQMVPYTSANSQYFHTNQSFVMAITNHMGFAFWNSYTSDYQSSEGMTVFVNERADMWLTNGFQVWYQGLTTNFTYSVLDWHGSQWNVAVTPANRLPNPQSFLAVNIDFTFLPESAYFDSTATFIPTWMNPGFDTNAYPSIYPLPAFTLITSNRFQAYILDRNQTGGQHVVDYVQMGGPDNTRSVNSEIQDQYRGINNAPYSMWYTNGSGLSGTGPNLGFMNQITVSQRGPPVAPANSWITLPNLPAGVSGPAAEAAFFKGFFTIEWTYNAKAYLNTNLAMQAPYVPTRVTDAYTLRQANDPVVHYLASDLNEVAAHTGILHSDDLASQPLPSVAANLFQPGDRYQPWGRNYQMEGIVGVLHNNPDNASYNLAYRDPLVWSSDDWDFPATNSLPLTTLGRIHRGTPWQTIYLKSTNLLEYVDATQVNPFVGLNTWENWTGDFNHNDTAILSPTSDWRLAALLTELFSTNDATQLLSVNAPTASLSQTLDGISVQTNSTTTPLYSVLPQLDPFLMASNSPQAQFILNALAQSKSARASQNFCSAGDILAAPAISDHSPWLNRSDSLSANDQIDYGISDEAYEAIPSQLLPRLRPDSLGALVSTNGGWNACFSGSDAFAYQVQSSTNLVDWQNVDTNQPVAGTFDSPVTTPAGSMPKFYRSLLLP